MVLCETISCKLGTWKREGLQSPPGPECEQPILAAFHRKADLRDRTGRKQMGVEPGSWEGWQRVRGSGLGSHIIFMVQTLYPALEAGSHELGI